MNKQVFYRIHAYFSLAFFIPFTIVCLTGCILVYKDEINRILTPQITRISNGERQAGMNFDELKEIIKSRYEKYDIKGWNIDKNPEITDKIWLAKQDDKEWRYLHIDAFSGEIKTRLLEINYGFIGLALEIHANLLMGRNGKIFVGIVGVSSLIICITGFMIYRNFWTNLFRLRLVKVAVFMSDIHKFIGVFSTAILLVISLSGAWWELSFLFLPKSAPHAIAEERIYDKDFSIDAIVKKAENDFAGFNLHYIAFPSSGGSNITLYGYKNDQNFLFNEYSSQITYAKNGELVHINDISEAGFKDKFLSTFPSRRQIPRNAYSTCCDYVPR